MRRLIVVGLLLAGALPAAPGYARSGYAIPPDNPFVGTAGARGEVYAYGLRNPWRWSFDAQTGAMLVADVGGNRREEITFLPGWASSGANLGWSCLEGSFARLPCRPPNYFPPSHQFRSGPDVVIGGYVVRDPALPSFNGRYLYGRYQSGVYALDGRASGRAVKTGAQVEDLTSFGLDGAGHLYATSYNGPVYRFAEREGALTLNRIGEFARPVSVVAPPGDADRLFIVEKRGRVRLRTDGKILGFLDISARVRDRGYEEGLLAFALAPDYASSGRVFAYYTNNAGHLQLDEYLRIPGSPNRIDAATRRPLLTIRHGQSASHQGGQLQFGPDGYLYLSTGDGDVKGDPEGDAQNLGSLLGKILRLDVGVAGSHPADTTAPALRARASGRQRALRLRGAVAYVRCTESCSVAVKGRLRIAGRAYRMRRTATHAGPGRRVRLAVHLTRGARRALEHGLRRRPRTFMRLELRAHDASGNRAAPVTLRVRVRR
jgi:Glucose / Sorbosone dehydrogenase